ncbi:MAG: S-layer homology domain-containing protein [Agathobaculum butyriciproducens]
MVDGTGYKITQNFDRFSSDYYLTATDSASLNNVFTQISQNINSAVNEKLDTTAVVKDTMTEYFNLPDNTTGIKVYTQNRQADGNWADRVETTDTTVKIDGQTVTVTGYDYATNFVSETAKADGSYGQKLVIEFTITPDLAKLAQDEAVKVDTNTGAGLYLGETAVATGESGKASFCGVKYDANGGTGTVPATQIGANGTKFTVPASCNTLKKDKAVLLGFSATKRDALVTNESDAADVVTEYAPAKDTLAPLYAVWAEDKNGNGTPDYKEKKYTITYAAGTEDTTVSGMPDAVTDVLANTEQTVSTVKPTREGYTFSGWTTTDVEVKDDKTFTMPKNNVTFTAQWTANDVTITFNANGGEWAENANVDDYTLIDNNTKASKTYQPSEAVAKIATDPVWNGHIFNGWYVKIPGKTGEEPEKYFITVWDATLQAQRIQEYGGVIYADWDDAAQPTEKLNYTTRQHYINEKGVEKLAVNITVQSAEKGTEISKLIQHLETDQTYYGQKYLYDDTKTTVNGVAYAKTMTLDTKGTAIDLYYYLDEWNDENDKVTGGDGTPDCQQAVVNFLADPNGSVGKDSEKPTQVFTLKKGKDGKYSEYVTPANVTPMPKENFVFDIWTKDNGETGVNPFVAQTLNGGDKVTYTAHFAADKIGSENKPDGIPDKYQAVVTYKVVGGTWKDGKTDAQVQVFTLKTKNEKTGVWEDANPVLGNTIPTGMISSYSRTASQSWDKDITKDTKVTESVTYTYTFTQGSSGGGGGSSTHYYISLKKVDAQDGEALSGAKFGLYLDGKQIATATSDRNGIVRFSMGSSNYRSLTDKSNLYCQELTAPEGYKLSNEKIAVSKKDVSTSSSTSDKNAKTVKNSRSKTPSMLNGKDHFAYIVGYPDKTVHPQSSITRAEVATIFFRLLTEETRTANATKTNKYADVSSDKWYNQAVSTLSAMGIIKGDSRGNFNPNAPITRAEFAAIAARFDKTEDVAAASFGDVAMHWAKPEISVAANNGWINGYTDGTFHPDSKITRAEAMAMINRVLQRLPESKADLLDGMIQWSDNADTSKWYYLAVQEATNSHYYELKANQHEKWTKLRENRDWTQLEK